MVIPAVKNSVRWTKLKSSPNKNDLNDITAAPFSMSFSQLPAAEKTPKMGQL